MGKAYTKSKQIDKDLSRELEDLRKMPKLRLVRYIITLIIQIALVIVLGNNLINSLSDIQTSIWYWLLTVIKIIGEILLVYLVANDIRLFSIGIKNTIKIRGAKGNAPNK